MPRFTIHDSPFTVLLGAHTSTNGGVSSSLPRAAAIGATAMQIFTKTPNQWREPAIGAEERQAFVEGVRGSKLVATNAHDSYLINLASPDPVLWTRSLISFTSELRRCEALQLNALVSHPGNFMDDRASGIARNAAAITLALEAVPGDTRLLMEMTAGSGTSIGSTFEEMALLIGALPAALQPRVGVCVDTAHLFAAGYDLANAYDDVWLRFGDVLGFERLGMLHLNDSKVPLGSHRDRHELIGEGAIGAGAFRRIMTDPRLAGLPKVIETPKGDDPDASDRRMLALLRRFARG
ncbi:MAG: deoxyribonuclease IV [Cytophagaceae bacterium]|nr:deoxyribonuclease IV [Gemmatimonadaceae bacterium]